MTTIIIKASMYEWTYYALWAKDASIETLSQAMNEIFKVELKPISDGLC